MYTEEEVREIQEMFTGKRALSRSEIDALRREFGNKEMPGYLYPVAGLFATNPDLYEKVSGDEVFRRYSCFGLFPETLGMAYGSETSPTLSIASGNRGVVGIIAHPSKKIVIKPLQNSREHEVAQIAADLGVGPMQYQTLDGFLTEQFVEGGLFSSLRGDKLSQERMYQLGRRTGDILAKLHQRSIFYNDTILTDDFGRSHLIVPESSPAVLFDYGVALKLDRSELSDEEVFNFARTYPMVNMLLGARPSEEQIEAVVQKYRPIVQNLGKDEIMSRDSDYITEGVMFAGARFGKDVSKPFMKGYKEICSS